MEERQMNGFKPLKQQYEIDREVRIEKIRALIGDILGALALIAMLIGGLLIGYVLGG
jgi:hypothetical protein